MYEYAVMIVYQTLALMEGLDTQFLEKFCLGALRNNIYIVIKA